MITKNVLKTVAKTLLIVLLLLLFIAPPLVWFTDLKNVKENALYSLASSTPPENLNPLELYSVFFENVLTKIQALMLLMVLASFALLLYSFWRIVKEKKKFITVLSTAAALLLTPAAALILTLYGTSTLNDYLDSLTTTTGSVQASVSLQKATETMLKKPVPGC